MDFPQDMFRDHGLRSVPDRSRRSDATPAAVAEVPLHVGGGALTSRLAWTRAMRQVRTFPKARDDRAPPHRPSRTWPHVQGRKGWRFTSRATAKGARGLPILMDIAPGGSRYRSTTTREQGEPMTDCPCITIVGS